MKIKKILTVNIPPARKRDDIGSRRRDAFRSGFVSTALSVRLAAQTLATAATLSSKGPLGLSYSLQIVCISIFLLGAVVRKFLFVRGRHIVCVSFFRMTWTSSGSAGLFCLWPHHSPRSAPSCVYRAEVGGWTLYARWPGMVG